MILLVCGGRNFWDVFSFNEAMRGLPVSPKIIIQGDAKGADRLAKQWASKNSVHHAEVPALWDNFGKAAGMKRNGAMLLLQPNYCLAMPGGVGTLGMVKLCKEANIPVWQPYG